MEQRQADGGQSMGLRERKRRATRDAIERAAIALVSERGYDNVTVAQICEASSVSQGTFFNYFRTLFLEVAGSFDWESDIAAQRIALVSETPSLMQLFLDNAFGFVSDFRTIVEAYFEANPSLRTCSDVLSSAEESYIVVSEALEAAKFALYRVADDPASGLPSADEVEAVIRRIVG